MIPYLFYNIEAGSDKKMTQAEKIKNFVAKARMLGAGNFTVDAENSILIRCEPGQYDNITLPPVETIQADALKDVETGELIIPETISKIEMRSFDDCSADTIIVQSDIEEVKYKDDYYGFLRARTVNIGKNVKSRAIADFVYDIDGLEAINVSEDNPWYASDNGILYNKDFTEIVAYPLDHLQIIYIMPNTVKGTIKEATFRGIVNLEKLRISDNVTELEVRAIWDCEKLREIELGQSIEVVNVKSFLDLPSLDKLRINGALKEIINLTYLD